MESESSSISYEYVEGTGKLVLEDSLILYI